MRRLPITVMSAVVAASVAGLLAVSSSPAQADPLCYKAETIGNQIPNRTVGPLCVTQYPFGVECSVQTVELYPTAGVRLFFCIP